MRSILTKTEQSLAEEVVTVLAPEELGLFRELVSTPSPWERLRGRSVGFGIDIPWDSLSPAIALLSSWGLGVAQGALDDALKERIRTIFSRVRTRENRRAAAELPPIPSQPVGEEDLRLALLKYGIALNLTPDESQAIANAILTLLKRDGHCS